MDPLLLVHSEDKKTSCLLKLVKIGFKLVSILRLGVRSGGLTLTSLKSPLVLSKAVISSFQIE